MRFLDGFEQVMGKVYMTICEIEARKSLCLRKKCGSIIVYGTRDIIGKGFNGPPGNIRLERCLKDDLPRDFKSDRTCCVHAEQRAIIDALRKFPNQLEGGRIYFLALNMDNQREFAGKPYCTICSKMALDVGIKEYVLWHSEGLTVYDTQEYNELSFAFRG